MELQANCVAAILFLAIVNLSTHVNGFTQKKLDNVLDASFKLRKSYKVDDQLDRRRQHHLDANVEVEPLGVDDTSPPNFLLVDYLNDGEIERRVSFNGITAKETSIANSG